MPDPAGEKQTHQNSEQPGKIEETNIKITLNQQQLL